MITMDEYIKECMRSEKPDRTLLEALDHSLMGIKSESGELWDALKKHKIYGKEFDRINFKEEIGDVLWYISIGLYALKVSYDDVTCFHCGGSYHTAIDSPQVALQYAAKEENIDADEYYIDNVTSLRNALGDLDVAAVALSNFVIDLEFEPVVLEGGLEALRDHDEGALLDEGIDAFGSMIMPLARLLHLVGGTFEEAARMNIAKLYKRYPDKFSKESALIRDLDAERAVLEATAS